MLQVYHGPPKLAIPATARLYFHTSPGRCEMSLRSMLTAVLFTLLAFCPVAAQGKFITCEYAPFVQNCEIELQKSQKSVAATFRLNLPTDVESGESPAVTFVPSTCCMRRTTVRADANGYVTMQWSSEALPESDVTIEVLIGSKPYADRIRLRKHEQSTPKPFEIVRYDSTQFYVGLRNTPVASPIRVEIDRVDGRKVAGDPAVKDWAKTCSSIRFRFQAPLEGKTTPDTGRARLEASQRPAMFDSVCVVETRWKLADAAGSQRLDLFLGGDNFEQRHIRIAGSARQALRLTAGFGVFSRVRRDIKITCDSLTEHARCGSVAPEELPKEVTIGAAREQGVEPYFALELPIFLRSNPDNAVEHLLYRHLRIVVGTTFEKPEENYFAGVALIPLFSSSGEQSAFQLHAGMGRSGFQAGMALDASALVKPVFSIFGIPGF